MKDLKIENAALVANALKQRKSSKAKHEAVPKKLLKYVPKIKLLGRKFSVMGQAWLPEASIFEAKRPNPVELQDERCWATDESMRQGLVLELFDFVPQEMHKYMQGTSHFGDVVS
jgi:hypothetical protein